GSRRCGMKTTFAVLVAGLLTFAPAPFPKAQRQSAAKGYPSMVGEWLIEDGRHLVISATHWTIKGGAPAYRISIKRPAFDLLSLHGHQAEFLGIYKVEGDRLTICYNRAAGGRPTGFDGPGKGQYTQTFKRAR